MRKKKISKKKFNPTVNEIRREARDGLKVLAKLKTQADQVLALLAEGLDSGNPDLFGDQTKEAISVGDGMCKLRDELEEVIESLQMRFDNTLNVKVGKNEKPAFIITAQGFVEDTLQECSTHGIVYSHLIERLGNIEIADVEPEKVNIPMCNAGDTL